MFLLQQDLFNTQSVSSMGESVRNSIIGGGWQENISKVIALVFMVAGILALVFLLFHAMRLIVSGGDHEKVKKEMKAIKTVILGLVLIVVAVFIVSFVGGLFGFELLSYIKISTIRDVIEGWSQSSGIN